MKNQLIDLNNHLFAQIERLSDESLAKNPELLKAEIARTKALSDIGNTVIDNAQLSLTAQRMFDQGELKSPPPMLEQK